MESDILVIDDDPDARFIIKTTLTMLGLPVREAVDGVNGMQKLQEQRPRLVILDFAMPNMDGLSFLRILRSDPANADLPVLLFTAHLLAEEQVEELDSLNTYVLQKGTQTVETLRKTVRQVLNLLPN